MDVCVVALWVATVVVVVALCVVLVVAVVVLVVAVVVVVEAGIDTGEGLNWKAEALGTTCGIWGIKIYATEGTAVGGGENWKAGVGCGSKTAGANVSLIKC